jgi:Domain of unknown function (DUF4349)
MTSHVPRLTAPRARSPRQRRTWTTAAWTVALTAGACLLAAGCSSGGTSANGTSAGGTSAGGMAEPAGRLGRAGGAGAVAGPAAHAGAAGKAGLTALPLPSGQSVIFTATLSVRTSNVQATVARATQLAQAAGGYVSGENASMTQSRRTRPMVSIQFKVPAAVYPSTLSALGSLGTNRSETQQAQDVTGTVADVNSRVTSAQAAIAQLRKLLTRAGTVGGLLNVQQQINSEEGSLEALQSQQRALARETTYATISMTITGPPPPVHHHHHAHKAAAGFLGGLTAGWRALRVVVAGLLTVAGAVLPFAIPLGLAALAAVAGRRWLGRRRAAGARPAD